MTAPSRVPQVVGPGEASYRPASLEALGHAAGGVVILGGSLVLLGWLLGIEPLKRVRTGLPEMNPTSALAFILAGLSLWLSRDGRPGWSRLLAARGAAALVLAIGLARIAGALAGGGWGIDLWVFGGRLALGGGGTARMAADCAANFAGIGLALLLIDQEPRRGVRPAQILALAVGLGATATLVGYAYAGKDLKVFAPFLAVPIHAALAALVLTAGILLIRPSRGLMAVVNSPGPGGVMARRLLPATVLIPAILGWLALWAERSGRVGVDGETAFLVVANLVVFIALVWWNAAQLYRADRERRRAYEALRESEAFYHSLVESLPQHILRKDLEGRFTFANGRFCDEVGLPLAQIVGKTDRDLFPEALADKYRRDDLEVIACGRTFETVEAHIAPGGERSFVHVIKTPVFDHAGQVIGTQGIFWDVTERRRAEEALRASRERFEIAVMGSRDGLWDWEIATGEVYFSPRWKAMIGYDDAELPNRFESWESRIHPDDLERAWATIQEYLDGRTEEYELEHRLRHKDGSYRWILARGVALRDPAGRPYRMAGSHTDITARKESERQLAEQNRRLEEAARSERQALEALKAAQSRMVQSEKLASLGQMVAGVAHEINNPLAFVGNNLAVLERDVGEMRELLVLYTEADDVLAECRPDLIVRIRAERERVDLAYTLQNLGGLLTRSRDGLRRIQQIVKDLRIFARLDEGDLNEADLNAGVESTVTIIQGKARKKGVRLETDLIPLPPVTCYPARINQVIMNLVSNAIDACRDGGRVVVRTRAEGEGVTIEVADDGEGIDPAVRDRIFDPFFTTKPVGEGTGLGLSISYGIVQDHGGTIEVDSAPGAGTTFAVRLPRRPRKATTARRPEPIGPASETHP